MTAAAIGRYRAVTGLPWVTWRQHRAALAGILLVLGGVGVFFLADGVAMHHAYLRDGLGSCGLPDAPACELPMAAFEHGYGGWAQFLPRFLEFIPAVLGVFVGAPLVARELESGTFRFAWTQGRSPAQWVATKLALLGVVLTALTVGFSALFGWWFGPWHTIMGRMVGGQAYEVEGVVFAARTLFGFTVGAFLGAVIRRTVPAMAATLAVWLAVAWPSVVYLRPLIARPVVARADAPLGISTTWSIGDWFRDPAGRHYGYDAIRRLAVASGPDRPTDTRSFQVWLTRHHYTEWVSYQPGSRFWRFQGVEAGAYAALALLLAAATIWWVRRRTT